MRAIAIPPTTKAVYKIPITQLWSICAGLEITRIVPVASVPARKIADKLSLLLLGDIRSNVVIPIPAKAIIICKIKNKLIQLEYTISQGKTTFKDIRTLMLIRIIRENPKTFLAHFVSSRVLKPFIPRNIQYPERITIAIINTLPV